MDLNQSNPSILDLSQRTTNSNEIIINHWSTDIPCEYSDIFDENTFKIETEKTFNIEQSLTDQYRDIHEKKDTSLSDTLPSKLDSYSLSRKKPCLSKNRIQIHQLSPCIPTSPYSNSNFLWSKYLSLINQRSISEEFFDHYLTSINSTFEIDMKLEYCYDTQRDLYWLTQIQLVSHCLILLHYIGIPDDDTSNDFWAHVYEQRCHPIGWCKEHSKLMLPPPIVTKRAIQQTALISNGIDKQNNKGDNEDLQTPPSYLFNKEIGLNPSEQLKKGMLLEIQDFNHPWTLWFVRILNNRGGRLHLRYIIDHFNDENFESLSSDIHIFYLDWRVHPIGWCRKTSSIYSYEIPSNLSLNINKQDIIDMCEEISRKQFLPKNLFKDQEELRKHRFIEGMKLEIFDWKCQNIYLGQIGHIHNEYFFNVIIDNDNQTTFVAYATHPYILPPHWAMEHRFALMKGKSIRQSEDYWNIYMDKHGKNDLASERCFNLITLNSTGNNRAEPGMKLEMIFTFNNQDYVFSVTLVHIIDHLMWLRIDNNNLFNDEQNLFYHVLPINSLDIFPVGWAKFNGFQLITPLDYPMKINTYEQDRYELFSSVTHYPRIPRVYLNEIYQLTLYVNIRCYCGPHLCSSRLARIPSKFGPGPYYHVLIDMFHYLLSTTSTSTNTIRALRRLEHSSHSDFQIEYIKAAKRAAKLIRPVSLPTNPYLIYSYLRHICTQLETCPNLISMNIIENNCPDKCHLLINTFALSIHSKHKRTQQRTAQNRQRKQKSLLCHLKPNPLPLPPPPPPSSSSSSIVEEIPSSESISESTTNDISPPPPPPVALPPPGSDRKTRGFRVHIEPRTHTVTRTNKKQKIIVKQEPIEIKEEPSTSTVIPIKESKRSRLGKGKRSSSPSITMNILTNSSSPTKKKRRSSTTTDVGSSSDVSMSKLDLSSPTYPVPLLDTRNPVTWNVNDVCSYLNQSGCSFALKTIQEQEIDGAALLLLDDLPKVQDLLEFKLGPAVKFCHVVEQLRTQVIDTFHSSPSLKTSRLSTNHSS